MADEDGEYKTACPGHTRCAVGTTCRAVVRAMGALHNSSRLTDIGTGAILTYTAIEHISGGTRDKQAERITVCPGSWILDRPVLTLGT